MRSRIAVVMTRSPKTSPQLPKLWLHPVSGISQYANHLFGETFWIIGDEEIAVVCHVEPIEAEAGRHEGLRHCQCRQYLVFHSCARAERAHKYFGRREIRSHVWNSTGHVHARNPR